MPALNWAGDLFCEVPLNKRFTAWLAAALVVCVALPVLGQFRASDWVAVQLLDSTIACQRVDDGTIAPQDYARKTNATQACKGMGWLERFMLSAAGEAYAANFSKFAGATGLTKVCPDGSVNTSYSGSTVCPPAAASFAWDSSALATAMLAVVSRTTGDGGVDIDLSTYCTGTDCASVAYSLNTAVTNWSVGGTGTKHLLHAGSATGNSQTDGALTLKMTYMGNSALSASFPWSYSAAQPTDSTAPNPIPQLSCAGATSTTVTCSHPSSTDPDDAVLRSGLANFKYYRNGSLFATVATPSQGLTIDWTPAARGTASGTATQSGASWTFSGNGGAGLEGTADNVNQISFPISAESVDVWAHVSSIPAAATYNKAYVEGLDGLAANAVAANCTLMLQSSVLYINSRNRTTAGGSRTSAVTAVANATMPATPQLHWHYDSTSGLSCETSVDNGVTWVAALTNFAITLPTSKYISVGCTATSAGVSIACVFDWITVSTTGTITNTLTSVPAGSASWTVKTDDVVGNLAAASPASTASPTAPPANAKAWHPGQYKSPSRYLDKRVEWMPDSAWYADIPASAKGYMFNVYWGHLEPTTAGVYNWTQLDQIMSGVAGTGRHAIIVVWVASCCSASTGPTYIFPDYIWQNPSGNYGYASSSYYGPVTKYWQAATMDRLIALMQAIYARYEDNPGFEFAVAPEESAISFGTTPDSTYSYAAEYTQLIRLQNAMGHAYKHAFYTGVNWLTADYIKGLMTNASANQQGVFGVDLSDSRNITADNVMIGSLPSGAGYDFRAEIASAHQLNQWAYVGDNEDAAYLNTFAINQGDAYIVWNSGIDWMLSPASTSNYAHDATPAGKFWTDIKTVMTNNPTTNTTCPSAWTDGCNTN